MDSWSRAQQGAGTLMGSTEPHLPSTGPGPEGNRAYLFELLIEDFLNLV